MGGRRNNRTPPNVLIAPLSGCYRFICGIPLGRAARCGTGSFLLFFSSQTSLLFILFTMLLIGCGLGLSANVYTLSVQSAWRGTLLGVASASTQFVRTIGGTVGVAVMGAILNGQITQRFAPIMTNFSGTVASLPIRARFEK